jgi:drug/metabolite transporter (DMT)-like permease
MSNLVLFSLVVLIWGSTWIAITFQLGEVDPLISIGYRFTLAVLLLGLWCWWKKLPLKLPVHIHVKMAAVGLSLYTLDYSLLYASQQYIISALVALASSCIIYMNVLQRRIFLGKAFRSEVIIGATLGLVGLALIFYPEFEQVKADHLLLLGIALAMGSFYFASLGNVISERILDHGTPVVQMNFWAMAYSLIFIYGAAWFKGAVFVFPSQVEYYISLVYLAVFGSVLAFGAYMKLLKQIGSDKASFVVLVYPLVALFISTLFEGYQWHLESIAGVVIILLGNTIAMNKLPKFNKHKTGTLRR